MSKKSKTELEFQLRAKKVEKLASVAQTAVKAVCIGAIAYFGFDAAKAYAGEITVADMALAVVTDLKINEWLAYLLAAGGVGYGLRQRKLRRDRIEQLGEQVKQLEQAIDARRSSSRLLPRGTTRPQDKRE